MLFERDGRLREERMPDTGVAVVRLGLGEALVVDGVRHLGTFGRTVIAEVTVVSCFLSTEIFLRSFQITF